MKNKLFNLVLAIILTGSFTSFFAQNNLPYPIIFVPGYVSGDDAFDETLEYLKNHDSLGTINSFDIILNADDNTQTATLIDDVKWQDFTFNGDIINLGRRSYSLNISDFVDGWTHGNNLFVLNFQEERIRGAAGTFNDYFDYSDQSALFKHGLAIKIMIQEVLSFTQAEKVVLVGWGLGGLSIREYLQRTDMNGIHTNWINPNQSDGHKVARVATYGAPHSGVTTILDPTKSGTPSGTSEAMRDMIYLYDSYTNCSGTSNGIYLYGGFENCIQGTLFNSTFDNVDVNCDGDEMDTIQGINESPGTFNYNPLMPLPENICYTYMTNLWTSVGNGAVDLERQWISSNNQPSPIGVSDTTLGYLKHTLEPSDYKTILRGIDEPDILELAYHLDLNKPTIGHLTFQQGMVSSDVDLFYVETSAFDSLTIYITNPNFGIQEIEYFDSTMSFIGSQIITTSLQESITIPVLGFSKTYIKISGTASLTSWQNPYKLIVTPTTHSLNSQDKIQILESTEIYPNPSHGSAIIKSLVPTSYVIFDSQGRIVLSSSELASTHKIDMSKYSPGLYFINVSYNNSKITKKLLVY